MHTHKHLLTRAALRTALLAVILCPLRAQAVTSDSIEQLGTLPGVSTSGTIQCPTGISGNGLTVVGYSSGDRSSGSANMHISHAFKWSGGMMTDLGTLTDTGVTPDNSGVSRAYGISADGSVIVGYSNDAYANERAVYWSSTALVPSLGGGPTDMGVMDADPGHNLGAHAFAVSQNGTKITGNVQRNSGSDHPWHAFLWQNGNWEDINPAGSISSTGTAIVEHGGVVYVAGNKTQSDYNTHAFRYSVTAGNTGGTMTDLGTLPGGTNSWASGISGDGSAVVGFGSTAGAYYNHAFYWSGGRMTDLGTLPGGSTSAAAAISADGKVIIGSSATFEDSNTVTRACRWVKTGASTFSAQSVEDWLRGNGQTVPANITYSATATNSDGSVVVGQLDSAHGNLAYIARVSSSGDTGSGSTGGADNGGTGLLVIDSNTAASLDSPSAFTSIGLVPQGAVVNGAHSLPLSYRVPSGKKSFWAAGDWGLDNHRDRDGNLGLAEMGAAFDLGAIQLDLSLGRTWASQDLVLGGKVDAAGTYALAEGIMPLHGHLWGVVSGYYNWSNADIRRGYLNAGAPDHSDGSADMRTWALRARLELDGIASIGKASFSPYADICYTHVNIEGYTETGGGFPASYDGRSDHATDLRVGVHGSAPVAASTSLVGIVEGVHRFEKHSSDVTGQVLGAGGFDFSLPGQSYDQNWMRFGAGVESKIGGGSVSVMANMTTVGQMPDFWLAARYQHTF
jgi:probable HAF family extracellular repeat protein